jgi:hypothetical protein
MAKSLASRISQLEHDARRVTVSRDVVPQFIDDTLPEQAAFIRDPARRKLVFSARRGGKSYGEGRFMLKEAWETPNVSCLYIGLTRDSAWRAMWRDVLKDLNTKLQLGAKFNETKLLMTLPNGSTIQLLGLDAGEDEKDKLLGGKYKAVVIDEAASFTIDLEDLVLRTVGPAVADHRGTIIMSGTPSNVHAGLFFHLTRDQNPMEPGRWMRDGWSCHRWCYEQNHYVRDKVEAEIADLVAAKGEVVKETPGFKQMWRGQWCVDDSMLVYKFGLGRNTFDGRLPEFRSGRWHYSLGIDTGWKASAFTLGAYHDHSPNLYILESWKRRAMDVTAMAEVVRWYESRFDIESKTIDGANKQAVEEMNNRHGLSMEAADKRDKFEFIDIMNDDFVMRRVLVSAAEWEPEFVAPFIDKTKCGTDDYVSRHKCGLLMAEYAKLVLDERKLLRLRKREEHPNSENHCADSALYEWRKAYPYLSRVLPPLPPALNTPEWYDWEMARKKREIDESFESQMQRNRNEQHDSNEPLDWL